VREIDRDAKLELQSFATLATPIAPLAKSTDNQTDNLGKGRSMDLLTDGSPGVVVPVLTADLLARVHQLNSDYLELLILEFTCPAIGGMRYLPDRVMESLRTTSPEVRQRLATTAYSLYSLGFEDEQFWRSALQVYQQPIDDRYGVLSSAVVQSSFCELALLHAWHVAVSQPMAARVLYGMPPAIIERLSRARLWQLRRIAVDNPGLLMPRWPANPCFWPEMIKFAALNDARRLHTLQQLGHQLLAIDLQSGSEKNNAARQRQRNLLKQRLHRSRGCIDAGPR
jgi:hypothetical protein